MSFFKIYHVPILPYKHTALTQANMDQIYIYMTTGRKLSADADHVILSKAPEQFPNKPGHNVACQQNWTY